MRSESLEWWTNISDTVAVVEVSNIKDLEPLNEAWKSQEVHCDQITTIKGTRQDHFIFRQDYVTRTGPCDARLSPKTKLLLFWARGSDRIKSDIVFWVNLAKPDIKLAQHAAYSNDCDWLDVGESVLTLVKARIAKETPQDKIKKRGLIVSFKPYESADMHWDFVRTADPDYKPILIKQLRDGDKESAIYNLISYPGKETVNLIRPFLNDPTTSEIHDYADRQQSLAGLPKYKTITYYPLRQTAYAALMLLGESPKKPQGYVSNSSSFVFKTGFENRTYFPFGDWKRIEE